ncbi:immune inhibitor A domain-containing protein [Paraliobacillus zengyii]|uniref:immune inhibitor A domain-containing protein n=1 Tax=Paraliobacillus zengyii TaxID=2213194 RepID=UPI000DD32D19|nr:immune inhibitor A domain-containing protein [Paraliobacillus zengyii]
MLIAKKALYSLVVLSIICGLVSNMSLIEVNAAKETTEEEYIYPFMKQHASGPFDIGIVNQDKILLALIEQGIIDGSLSKEKQEEQLNEYLLKRSENAEELAVDRHDQKKLRNELLEQADLKQVPAGVAKQSEESGVKAKSNGIESIVEESWDGAVQTDEVLVLLIDFADYQNSNITEADNPVLLYDNYTKEHYENMVFADETYKGGNGEDFISMKAFYEQQSGGSYTIDGQVAGWYTAEHPAAYYGANEPAPDGNDIRPRELVKEALAQAAADPSINLADFDKEDLYDLDGDGDYREPDGIIDHLMIVHAGTGEEAGGGSLNGDAIWSHSWNLDAPTVVPGTEDETDVPYWGGIAAYDYTVQPEDGAVGVFAHEFGHDLGLPDSYDTNSTAGGVGAPTDYWTIMAAGSWAGLINGTEPTGFSPYDKEFLQNRMPESNWFKDAEYSLDDIKAGDISLNIDQASVKGTNADAVKVTLPDKLTTINTPTSGEYQYFSGNGNDLNNSLVTTINLKDVSNASFKFNAFYDIELDWDYGSVQVNDGSGWVAIPGNITTDSDPYGQNPGHGITGDSKGWIEAVFNLDSYVGKEIQLRINYWTDVAASLPGLYVDDLEVIANDTVLLTDDAESEDTIFTMEGFTKSDGNKKSDHYYLIEWRNYAAADTALERITRGNSVMTLDPGMVVWYVDNKYDNNWVGDHPGDGFLGVVDAHQETAVWSNGETAVTRYQIQDAAFSLNETDKLFLDYLDINGTSLEMESQAAVSVFNDAFDYTNPGQIYAGRNVLPYGLTVAITDQAQDLSVAQLLLNYETRKPTLSFEGLSEVYSSKESHHLLELKVAAYDPNLSEEVTVETEVIDPNGEVVATDDQSFVAENEETSLDVSLKLPEGISSGIYTLKMTANDGTNTVTDEGTFTVDNEKPTIEVDQDGNQDSSKEASVKVNIQEAESDSLQYVWSESEDLPTDGWTHFDNGDTLKLSDQNGSWYLHVRATDAVGNVLDWHSQEFTLDNTIPEITLEGDNPLVLQAGAAYTEPGYMAIDESDGDITDSVEITGEVDNTVLGEYILTYLVTDTAGNETIAVRKVHVVDEEVPYIELSGDTVIELQVGTSYQELGYVAEDNLDGDITEQVVVTGEIDTETVGEYTLVYTVADENDNVFAVTRTVLVVDHTAPIIELKGDASVTLEVGAVYEDAGISATDNYDGDVTDIVTVTGSVDTDVLGEYTLTYKVIDESGNEATITRTVHIIDTHAPTIELAGVDPYILEAGLAYLEQGFTATDNYEGNITDNVIVSGKVGFAVGEYTVNYTVTDSSGNETTAIRTVKVVDTIAPVIKLKGSNPVEMDKGTTYKEPGYVASDRADGDLTDKVSVSGDLDVDKVGAYTLIYTVKDASGNETIAKRIVTINALTKEEETDSETAEDNDEVKTGTETSGNKGGKTGAGEAVTASTKGETATSGSNLPSTATNIFNLVGIGVVVLLIGGLLFIFQRRRKVN